MNVSDNDRENIPFIYVGDIQNLGGPRIVVDSLGHSTYCRLQDEGLQRQADQLSMHSEHGGPILGQLYGL